MKKNKLLKKIKELNSHKLPSENFWVKGCHLEVDEKLYLLLTFYTDSKEYFIFITKENYITFEKKLGKWKTGKLKNILSYKEQYKLNFKLDTKELLKSYFIKNSIEFSKDDSTLKMIHKYQEKICSMRLERKHDKIRYEIDCVMNKIKPLPKKIYKWVDRVAHFESRYIFYKRKVGYCSVCHKENIHLDSPKHNKSGVCPNCKTKIVYKALGYSKNIKDYCNFTYLQKTNNGFFIRIFSSIKDYSKNIKSPEIKYNELRRYFVNNGKINYYHYGRFFNKEYRWCNGVYKSGFYSLNITDRGAVYTRNLKSTLNGTMYMSSALLDYIKYVGNYRIDVEDYLYRYSTNPSIEYFLKLGLFKIFNEILLMNNSINLYEGKKFYQRLGIKKEHLNMLRAINGNRDTLRLLRHINENSLKINLDQLKWITSYNLQYSFTNILSYTTITKAINYLKKVNKENYHNRLQTWIKYLEVCDKLKYNFKNSMVLFPKELDKRYDEEILIWAETNIELCDIYLKERYKVFNEKYSFIFKDLSIIAPKNRIEIIKEGESLSHCVRKKIEEVALGKTNILFIRKNNEIEKPYYTLEVSAKNKIIQCRGYKNAKETEDIKEILSAYDSERLSQLK